MSAAEPAEAGEASGAGEAGKRVSWVELYLDLVFVLGIGRLAHVIVSEPTRQSVWIALGLFVTLHVATVVAAMGIAGALWWLYFDSAADINLKVLELSGGSPTMARAIFAVGHMLAAFALLITASGVGLLVEADPPRIAYWLACIGIGIYLVATRAFLIGTSRVPTAVKTLLIVATFALGRLHDALSPHAYLWLLTGWTVVCAALATRTAGRDDAEALERYLGERRVRT